MILALESLTPLEAVVGLAILVFGPAGAAHISVKQTLNGTRETVRRIETKVDGLVTELPIVRERVSVLEARNEERDRLEA